MNQPTAELLQHGIVEHLVGVIDLKSGAAVHAVEGNRESYRSIVHPALDRDGDAIQLASFYATLGVQRLYIADLDAIQSRNLQSDLLVSLLNKADGCRELLLDIGYHGEEDPESLATMEGIVRFAPQASVVVATESAVKLKALERLVNLIGVEHVVLGLDYQAGQWIHADTEENDWLRLATTLGISRVLILDLKTVGSGRGPSTFEICRRVRSQSPQVAIVSGGGIRNAEDVRQLRRAGCDRCLVATALLQHG